ncbi:hypothetical protein [Leptolyngbya sp. BC1307]|uniref:hypothetical protein n=1 Tax=Leptolyngbya sp. BC1307 TaxID=2029589 RepID=UPI00197DA62A|nr:hypothetical protein [Leptolyngbya sp. BC1307]
MTNVLHQLCWRRLLLLPAALLLTVSVSGCRVEQTSEGELPDVDIEAGEAPTYDVEGPEVDVSTEERTIKVPTLDIEPPSEDVE